MNDDDLATQISAFIPPEAALAARVAQLERAHLDASSDRIAAYKDEIDRNTTVDNHFVTVDRQLAALTALARDVRIAVLLTGIAATAACLGVLILALIK